MALDMAAKPISNRTKAAIIIRLLRSMNADVSLTKLPATAQIALAKAIGDMGPVDHDTVDATIAEFTSAVDAMALPAAGGYHGALVALDGQISPEAAAQVAEDAAQGDPEHAWLRLSRLKDEDLCQILLSESIEIAALLLSKLPSGQAARLLVQIPGDRARQLACTTPHLDHMRSASVSQIAHALAADYCAPKPQNFDQDAVNRMGAILNATKATRRDEVLDGLDTDNPDFADKVRKTIFTFENIPERIDPLDIPKIARNLDNAQLTIALGGALATGGDAATAAEFILDNMSKRIATQIRDDINDAPPPKAKDVEITQTFIVDTIRNALDSGEISMISDDA